MRMILVGAFYFSGVGGEEGGKGRDWRDWMRLRESLLGDCHSVEDFVVK